MTTTSTNDQRLRAHRMFTESDLRYLRGKGYTDEQVLAIWDRDRDAGRDPVHHAPVPDALAACRPAGAPAGAANPPAPEYREFDGVVNDEEAALADAVRDAMSPEAVACVAAALQTHRSNAEDIDLEVAWFRDVLIAVLGGKESYRRIRNELDV